MYQVLEPKPLPPRTLKLKGISARTITEHYKLYEGYVNKVNETREKLRAADPQKGNPTYSEIRALKRGESYALNGAKLHELYFEELGGAGGRPTGDFLKAVERQYGSYDAFLAEFRGTGLGARGWAVLAYDVEHKELFIYMTDDQHDGHVIQAVPILPMDVFEHAYSIDYGTNRAGYIDAFFQNLDWHVVNRRFLRAVREAKPHFRLIG